VPAPYERFEAWKLAHELALEVYRITERWPAGERYQLTSQVRRAALSVPTNIAEGAECLMPTRSTRSMSYGIGAEK
jgi:four helix bundle protein